MPPYGIAHAASFVGMAYKFELHSGAPVAAGAFETLVAKDDIPAMVCETCLKWSVLSLYSHCGRTELRCLVLYASLLGRQCRVD